MYNPKTTINPSYRNVKFVTFNYCLKYQKSTVTIFFLVTNSFFKIRNYFDLKVVYHKRILFLPKQTRAKSCLTIFQVKETFDTALSFYVNL